METWRIVGPSWDERLTPLGWVSYAAEEAEALVREGGLTHLLVEARADFLTASLIQVADSHQVIVLALITGVAGEDIANATGVGHRIRQPEDLLAFVEDPSVAKSPGEVSSVPHPGFVVTVWGPTGSPGRSTVAIALAGLFGRRGITTVLIDADSRSGALAPALGILDEVPGFVASCRLASRGELSTDHLVRLVHRYSPHEVAFDVLTGISSTRVFPEVTVESVHQVVALCRGMWQAVVIDAGSDLVGSDREPGSETLVASTVVTIADQVVAVCWATPVGVARFARVANELRERRGPRPLTVILNGVDSSRRSLADESAIREALRRFAGVSHPLIVARDPAGVRQAEMAGLTLVDAAPGSPFLRSLSPLSQDLVAQIEARRQRQIQISPVVAAALAGQSQAGRGTLRRALTEHLRSRFRALR